MSAGQMPMLVELLRCSERGMGHIVVAVASATSRERERNMMSD